ncbi:hypothetical protein ACGH2B_00775 [Streptomyces sp. BBFR2]|uniref:hypothetical protein n=1 Tax=Streptomyces sp. BBFR2 TaxID=3372854 RepID=UPI0037D9ED37
MRTPEYDKAGEGPKARQATAGRAPATHPEPRRSLPQQLAQLQRSAGNAAVTRALGRTDHPLHRGHRPAPATTPAVQRAPAAPANPQEMLSTGYWERAAGVTKPDGSADTDLKSKLLDLDSKKQANPKAKGKKGAKQEKASPGRTKDAIITETGPALLKQLSEKPQNSGRMELFRSMSVEEAEGLLTYWGKSEERQKLTDYIASGQGTGGEFNKRHQSMVFGSHLGDQEQADTYYARKGPAYEVQVKFTLKPGAHEELFKPDYTALAQGYDSSLIRHAHKGEKNSHPNAEQSEGALSGYVGLKPEQHGPFSLGMAVNKKDRKSPTPSHLLFQLFVENVSLVKGKTKEIEEHLKAISAPPAPAPAPAPQQSAAPAA